MATPAAAALPIVLDKYQTLSPLGEGGMGQVFLARSLADGAQVVVKKMHGHLADNPTARASFQRELDVMKRFRHPNAVALLDGGWDGPTPCLVLEYVHGINLEKYTKPHRRMDPRRVGRWLAQLCQVLHVAHSGGILHRDLSLANLMLIEAGSERERIKVMDFGLARLHGGVYLPMEKLTGPANTIGGGTPDYLCPEQIRGESVDARGDLYSVGVILYRLLTGRLPFESAKAVSDILLAHVQVSPPRFAEVGAGNTPLPLEAVTRLCLEKNPGERPQTARELAELYGEALGEPIAPPESFPVITPRPVVETPRFDPTHVLDRLEAWMPEQIAVMKLRGFIGSVGGEVTDSQPGLLRMRLLDPRCKPAEAAGYSWFGRARPALADPQYLQLDLYMEKKQVDARGFVEIVVVLERGLLESRADAQMREGFGQRLCKELRAYLMIGR
jgi:serine/threonine protein kinase